MTEDRNRDVNDTAPTSISHVVGQKSVVEQVSVALDAAFTDGRPMDSALLVGPPGCGKTLVAHVVAQEMASDLHEVLGQTLTGPAELNSVLLQAKDRDIVFIDEAHEIPKQLQTTLYLAIDQARILLSTGKGGAPSAIPLRRFTLMLASTDEHQLLQPLRDRMKLLLRFQFYDTEELSQLLHHRIQALSWDIEEEILPLIAQRSRGTPRLAIRLLQSARRVCRSEGESTITRAHLNRACALEQLDSLGLGPIEQQYLAVLAEGTVRLNVVSSRVALPARTLSQVVEPFLIRAGLVGKDNGGRRQLTAKGREHLSNTSIVGAAHE